MVINTMGWIEGVGYEVFKLNSVFFLCVKNSEGGI